MRLVKERELGPIRQYYCFPDGRQLPTTPEDKNTEILVSFEFQNGTLRHGWLTRTPVLAELAAEAQQPFSPRQTLLFAEVSNGFYCVLEGQYFGHEAYFCMKKKEVKKLLDRMIPAII